MKTWNRILLGAFVLIGIAAPNATAGMPWVPFADMAREIQQTQRRGLSDLASQRLEVISFFLLGLLVCTGVIQWVWNGLRKDFPALPRLSYGRSLGIIVLWGLLFVIILTMISGARELMTPGAWEKKGITYKLPPPPPIEAEIRARVEAIEHLGKELSEIARSRGGAFPADPKGLVDAKLWQLPKPFEGRYRYVGGRLPGEDDFRDVPVLYEPESVGPDRLVFMNDGHAYWKPETELERILSERKP